MLILHLPGICYVNTIECLDMHMQSAWQANGGDRSAPSQSVVRRTPHITLSSKAYMSWDVCLQGGYMSALSYMRHAFQLVAGSLSVPR